MKRMILITTDFPYGAGESFLETEVSYYTEFDRVHIFPIGHHAGKMRAVPANVAVYKKRSESSFQCVPLGSHKGTLVLCTKAGLERNILKNAFISAGY